MKAFNAKDSTSVDLNIKKQANKQVPNVNGAGGGPNLVKYLNQRIDNFQSQMFNQTVMLNSKTENNPLLPSFDSASVNKNEKAMMSKTSAIGKLTKNNNNPENTKQSTKTLKSRNNSSGTKLMKASSVENSAKRERV